MQRKAKEQQVADRMNVLFERSDCFEKQIGHRLAVHLHEVGDLLVVHAFEVFEENCLFLAAGQLFNRAPDFDLIFAQELFAFDFSFNCLIIGKLVSLVDVQERMRTVAAPEFLHKLVTQSAQEVNGNELDLNVLTPFPDVDHQVLDGIFDELPVGSEIAGVVEKSAVLLIGQLAKRQTVTGLALVPEIQENFILLSDTLFLVQISSGRLNKLTA